MDPRERLNDNQESLQTALDGAQSSIWTSLPGYITKYSPTAMTVEVQPTIQGLYRGIDGNATLVTMPLLVDVPVLFPGGGGLTLTFPIAIGDECLVWFACRCIDAWWQSGGVQPPGEFRMHDLSDGFALVGPRSQPRVLTAPSTSAAQLRTEDGTTYLEILPDGHVRIVSPNPIVFSTPALHVTGQVIAGFGGVDQVGLQTHVHGGVQTGGGDTSVPIAGT